ncbi:MAG: hypothetical protein IJW75_05440, partial [Alphaproteobacteria bacterium]|nr:hypothetical protein [Alphaproteobacteria bacterium]
MSAATKAMEVLQKIQHSISENLETSVKLEHIMKLIADGLGADACACYITVDDTYLELFCKYGLENEYKGNIRYGETITGEIAAQRCSMSRTDTSHPIFKSALGSPMLRWNKTSGVILIINKQERQYTQDETSVLETIAMFLTTFFSTEEISAYKKKLIKSRGLNLKDRLKGLVLNKGFGVGCAVVHQRRQALVKIFSEDKNIELARLEDAKERMNKNLDEKFNSTRLGIGEHTDILETYRMFAKDKGWYKKISDNIEIGLTAEAA